MTAGISLCLIVRDEEPVIGRCLNSVQEIADEIVVVDTGSGDQTKDIVSRYTDKVYDFVWVDDFAAARNFAFSLATRDYILWLDADDVILQPDRDKFMVLKHTLDPAVDSVLMVYNLARDENGQVALSLRRNRLVKRSKHFRWVGAVHEYLAVTGHIINSDIAVTHLGIKPDSDRNLRIFEGLLDRGTPFSPRDLYYYAGELMEHGRPEQAIAFYQRFLATQQGWVEDNIAACGRMADCYLALNDEEQYLRCIYRSFDYDRPRPDFCCRLGDCFLRKEQLPQAIFWYTLATQLQKPVIAWGVVNHTCYTWLPHLQLCACYDRAGNYELARKHNELAAEYIPDDPRIRANRQYLENRSPTAGTPGQPVSR
ncbi:MAG: glycosyltransferase [Peptococcaceae bacterium]|nr:glycosyltransferase [Peptococcaceae bacterium]